MMSGRNWWSSFMEEQSSRRIAAGCLYTCGGM